MPMKARLKFSSDDEVIAPRIIGQRLLIRGVAQMPAPVVQIPTVGIQALLKTTVPTLMEIEQLYEGLMKTRIRMFGLRLFPVPFPTIPDVNCTGQSPTPRLRRLPMDATNPEHECLP